MRCTRLAVVFPYAALLAAGCVLVHVEPVAAAELPLVRQGQAVSAIVANQSESPTEQAVAKLLLDRIAKRTGCRLTVLDPRQVELAHPAQPVMILLGSGTGGPPSLLSRLCEDAGEPVPTPETVGAGGFVIYTIQHDAAVWVVLAGADARGMVSAAGKFLRSVDFAKDGASVARVRVVERIDPAQRMFSQPQKPAQWGNAFLDAPIEQILEYIEDMALWGTDSLMSLCAWQVNNPFKPDADPRSKQKWSRVCRMLLRAQSLGMEVGYFDYPNCLYEDQLHLRDLGGQFRYPKDACPSIPEVRTVLLENRRSVYRSAKESGLTFSFLIHNAHDFGGCDCPKCAPWMKTFLRLNEELYEIARQFHPGVKIYLTTWGCSADERRILFEYLERERPAWVLGVLDRPGVTLPEPYVSVGWQTIFADGPHECYGRMGADPLPRFLQEKIQQFRERGIRVIHTYSEGIDDDINNMVVAQVCRDPSRTDLRALLAEYSHASFGTKGTDSLCVADLILGKFTARPSGRFNASLRVAEPEAVLAALGQIESRLPDWGKQDWRWGILKTRVQMEVLDQRAQAHADWPDQLRRLLVEPVAKGADQEVLDALRRAESLLVKLDDEVGSLEAEGKELARHLYHDLYGTPHRDAAHGSYVPAVPHRGAIRPALDRCRVLTTEPDATKRRRSAAEFLGTLPRSRTATDRTSPPA